MRLIDPVGIAVATIWQEARGESHEGRVAVAEVIRNRMTHGFHSDGSVVGTCLAPYQFSGWNTKDPNRIPSLKLDDANLLVADCLLAWQEAMGGSNWAKDADSYFNPAIVVPPPDWYDPKLVVATIGDHVFLRIR